MLTKSQHKNLVFLPFPKGLHEESFADFDSAEGLNYCLYVDGGLVTDKKYKRIYVNLLKSAHKFFTRGDE